MDLDPTLLRALVAVKDTGGFTRAAHRLNLTQSAISHQIRRLEDQVGRPLLHRTTRTLTLTEDGHDFVIHAEKILASLDALARRFETSPVCGVVRFGVPDTYMGDRMPTMLCQFSRAYPDVRLDVCVGSYMDLRTMLKTRELDLAVVLSDPAIPDSGTVLRNTKFVWAAADIFVAKPGASLPLAFAPSPCLNRQAGVGALEGTSVQWHIAFSSPSQAGIRAAVLGGLAVTVDMQCDLQAGMREVGDAFGLPPLPDARFLLQWSDGEKTPAACEFGKLLSAMPAPEIKAPGRRKRSR